MQIVPCPAFEHVISFVPKQAVWPFAAADYVVARESAQLIVGWTAVDEIVAKTAIDEIPALAAVKGAS